MQEKRHFARFKKQYTIKFALKDTPHINYDVSQLLDISKGGLKFFSYEQYALGTKIIFYVKFPFLYPNETVIYGEVIGLEEVLAGKTYKIRVKFVNLTPFNISALEQMEKLNLKK